MQKAIIIYWSGTGNTEIMANKIYEGLKTTNVKTDLVNIEDLNKQSLNNYDLLVLGSPAMGDEQLEEEVFEPFFEQLIDSDIKKDVAIFGSYGWGNKVWINKWEDKIKESSNLNFINKIAVYSTPTTEEEDECINFGKELIK